MDNAATHVFDKHSETPCKTTQQHSVLLCEIQRKYDEMSQILCAHCVQNITDSDTCQPYALISF
jgi:hypothetical protein